MNAQPEIQIGEVVITPPRLRGWMHLVCFVLAIPAGIVVVAMADGTKATAGAAVYAVGLVALFGVSGMYHRFPWRPSVKRTFQRLDHTTIFVMIAGSYTPLCLVALDGSTRIAMLVMAWTGAVAGGVFAWVQNRTTRILKNALYIALGWAALFAAPQLLRELSTAELVLIAVGGVLFTAGSIILLTNKPDPWPRWFGYHEVWHTFVVAAVVCQLVAIASVVDSSPLVDMT